MKMDKFIKIGSSVDPWGRLDSIQIGSPFPVTLIGSMQCDDMVSEEQKLQRKYGPYGVGREWFQMPKKILSHLLNDLNGHNGFTNKCFACGRVFRKKTVTDKEPKAE